jgi:hypothetical protein
MKLTSTHGRLFGTLSDVFGVRTLQVTMADGVGNVVFTFGPFCPACFVAFDWAILKS